MSTVLILGASRGIGYALAEQYLADGWRVIGSVRQVEDAQKLKAIGVNPIQIDVNDLNDCASLGWLLDDEKIDVAILGNGFSEGGAPLPLSVAVTNKNKTAIASPLKTAKKEEEKIASRCRFYLHH